MLLCIQNLIHSGIIYPQKFVCSSNSVRVIMLTLGMLLVDELIYWFIFRLVQDKYFGYLKEDFSESRRATFGNVPGRDVELPRLTGGASSPAKAVIALLFLKRLVSPISAMSCGPYTFPTPNMDITVSYSGSEEAILSISFRM